MKMKRWFKEMFDPQEFNGLDTMAIGEAFNDPSVRREWLLGVFEAIRDMNLEVDRRLLSDSAYGLTDLCAKRKAYQDVLEAILDAKRKVTQGVRHNPRPVVGSIDLDRVTV